MDYRAADAKREFDFWSDQYDHNPLQWCFFGPAHQMLLAALRPEDGHILDIGCGTGQFASKVLQQQPRATVWGIDLSDGMLRQAEARADVAQGRLHLVQGNSEHLPFADDVFDVITCTHSFHHYPHQEQALSEMHRVLRPGGRVLIIDGDRDRLWGWLIYDVLVVLVEGPVKHLTSGAFRSLYEKTGFSHVQQQRRGGPLPFLLTSGSAEKTGKWMEKRKAA